MSKKKNKSEEVRQTTIGGQALIEGLMMVGPEQSSLAVRLQNGLIYREERPSPQFGKVGRIPFVRGTVRLFTQLYIGMKALTKSADLSELSPTEADQLPADKLYRTASENAGSGVGQVGSSLFEQAAVKAGIESTEAQTALKRKKSDNYLYVLAMLLGAFGGMALFIFLPNLIIAGLRSLLGGGEVNSFATSLMYNLLEGLVRIGILLLYMWLVSKSKDIARTWQYHGAEHKTIACYERGLPLTVEHVRTCSRFHPRCGTSFLFLLVFISSLIFSLFGWQQAWLNLLIRLMLIPVVIGISFELLRYSGSRVDQPLGHILTLPGLWLQRLTTQEPDDQVIETAIAAMLAVLPEEEGADAWS